MGCLSMTWCDLRLVIYLMLRDTLQHMHNATESEAFMIGTRVLSLSLRSLLGQKQARWPNKADAPRCDVSGAGNTP